MKLLLNEVREMMSEAGLERKTVSLVSDLLNLKSKFEIQVGMSKGSWYTYRNLVFSVEIWGHCSHLGSP